MTVNITQNALSSQPGSDISRTANTKQVPNKAAEPKALSKLSSGISLPESSMNSRPQEMNTSYKEDSSEVSAKAANLNSPVDIHYSEITTMQEEVGKLDELQTALESISSNIWGIGKQVTAAQKSSESEPVLDTAPVNLSIDTSTFEADREEMQKIVAKHLNDIDHTGSDLLYYLSDYREKFMSDLDIRTESLGKNDNTSSNSLAALNGGVALSSQEASDIVARAQEQVASLQVSTEMHRSNLLNDIGKAIATAASSTGRPEANQSIESSVQEISNILRSNPNAISQVSQVDSSQVASLLM